MATPTLSAPEELRRTVLEAQTLQQGNLDDKDSQLKMAQLLDRCHTLQAQIEQGDELAAVTAFANKSAGGLPLAAPGAPAGHFDYLTPAGVSTFEGVSDGRRTGVKLLEQYGEGIFDPKIRGTIGKGEYRDAFKSYIRRGASGLRVGELKTLQEGSDTAGGYLVPLDVLERVISKEPTPTRVAGRVTQLQTSRDNLMIPRVNYVSDDLYTTGMRVTWTGEIPASSTTHRVTEPLFGQTQIPVYTAMMSIPITNDMIEDASFPLVSWVSGKFAETIDLLRDNLTLNGTGLGQPSGMLLNPGDAALTQPAVVNSGSATSVTADGLIDLAFALPEQYEDGAVAVLNKTSTFRQIAKLKDSDGDYIFNTGVQDSGLQSAAIRNRKFLGYELVLSGFMPNIAANAFPIIFGDLAGYYLVNRIGFSIQVLRELYAETNQILLLGRIRFGGQVVEAYKLKVLKISA